MTAAEIFSKANSHQVTGVMFHDDLINYFDFLSLDGFKMIHVYQYFSENAEMQKLASYFMNHFNTFIPVSEIKDYPVIPDNWRSHTRFDVDEKTKSNGVKNAIQAWRKWEVESKSLYEKSYADLISLGEISAAQAILESVKDVDGELSRIDALQIKLNSISYDMVAIYDMQESILETYKPMVENTGKQILGEGE